VKSPRRKVSGIALGALLIAVFALVAVASGLGHPNPSGEEVAVVEDAEGSSNVAITQEEFDQSLEQFATRQGLEEVPPEDDPQYELLRESALADLLLAVWVRGEAEDRGIEATESEVEGELERVKEQQFDGNENRFQRFLEESGFTEESAREQLELNILSNEVQGAVLPESPEVTTEEIEAFYEGNPEQFEQPETRNIRSIVTDDEAEAEDAAAELAEDSSEQTWNRLARQVSTDDATSATGGLRENVVEGQNEAAFDEQAFTAAADEIVGPFEGEAGFYVLQVEQVNPAQDVTLADAREQIESTLVSARQQEAAQAFQQEFLAKWTARTFCAEGYRIDRCANAETTVEGCDEQTAEETGCPAAVPSIAPIEPGTATIFGGAPPLARPQGPATPVTEQPPGLEGLPPGLEGVPGGAPPGQGAPPQGAPPQGAPPQGAPPQGAPPQGE